MGRRFRGNGALVAIGGITAFVVACGARTELLHGGDGGDGGDSSWASTTSTSSNSGAGGAGAGPVEGDCGLLEGPRMVRVIGPTGEAYCIDATETTNAHYKRFLAADVEFGSQEPRCQWNTTWEPGFWEEDDEPVVAVDFCDAVGYCAWAGKRLCGPLGGPVTDPLELAEPTRSEWSWACSAGGTKAFPYGNEFDPTACVSALTNGDGEYTEPEDHVYPVASFERCQGGFTGLFDMSGNVSEWEDACTGEGPEELCVVRGGGYYNLSQPALACAGLLTPKPQTLSYGAGIRCCL
jgi:formylglycine-generating enzyme required for sulfatase activity